MSHQYRGEYNPPELRFALKVCRFANAEWCAQGNRGMRYIVDAKIHEAMDRHCEVSIMDCVESMWLTVSDLLLRLSPENAASCSWGNTQAVNGRFVL